MTREQIKYLRKKTSNQPLLSSEVLALIKEENWFNLWVPQKFKGKALSLKKGLNLLYELARIDGSLGWTVTLCGGANYFVGNLRTETAEEFFLQQDICFGGSGMINGTAEKIGDAYLLNGIWKYATGAPYLSHFTCNAAITKNNIPLTGASDQPLFLSFIVEKNQVKILPDWRAMGLKATASHSFILDNVIISERHTFQYSICFHEALIFKIPFAVFADLTLLVNYIGMGAHFVELSAQVCDCSAIGILEENIQKMKQKIVYFADQITDILEKEPTLADNLTRSVHQFGRNTIAALSQSIIEIYPHLGVKAADASEEINQVFRDYFTATQHKNFRT